MTAADINERQANEFRNSARNLRERAEREENLERAKIMREEADGLEKQAEQLSPAKAAKK